jgi:hypothetical protein
METRKRAKYIVDCLGLDRDLPSQYEESLDFVEDQLWNAIAEERHECLKACGLCNGLGYDGMPGEERECYACTPIRARSLKV